MRFRAAPRRFGNWHILHVGGEPHTLNSQQCRSMTKKLRMILLAACAGLIGLGASEQLTLPGFGGLVSPAEARIGRPLTPFSVAGVARRTVRAARLVCTIARRKRGWAEFWRALASPLRNDCNSGRSIQLVTFRRVKQWANVHWECANRRRELATAVGRSFLNDINQEME